MRVVSWTVVVGSVTALLLTSVSPWLSEFRLPDMDRDSVRGTMGANESRDLVLEDTSTNTPHPSCETSALETHQESCTEATAQLDPP